MGRRGRWAPIVGMLLFTLWVVWPLLKLDGWLFSNRLEGDFLRGAWLYDFTSRQVREGILPFDFTDFGYPEPINRGVTLPNVVDAALLAPVGWIFGWPRQLGVTMGLIITFNALGLAWLARAAGCKSWGIAVAGCLGAVMWPVWRELHIGRINDAWTGAAFACLAAFLDLARQAAGGDEAQPGAGGDGAGPPAWRGWLLGGTRVLVAAALGALTLSIYPPHAAILAVPGMLLLGPHLRRRPGRVLLALGLAAGLGMALAWPEIALMTTRAGHHKAPCIADTCPKPLWYVEGIRMLGLKAGEAWLWLPATGAAVGSWALMPLALLSRRRWVVVGLLAVLAVYVRLALGACPTLHPVDPGVIHKVFGTTAFEDWVWCHLEPVHDYGRFLLSGLGLAAVLSGLAVDALVARGGLWRAAGVALGVAAVAHGAWVLREGTFPAHYWQEVPTPVTARFLATAEPGPVAELPWDESGQYLSLLAGPRWPRVNPVAPVFTPESRQPFVRWLHSLARGEIPPYPPSRAAITALGLRWVFHDPGRCSPKDPWGVRPCGPEVVEALTQTLGPGQALEGGVRVWDMRALPEAPSP